MTKMTIRLSKNHHETCDGIDFTYMLVWIVSIMILLGFCVIIGLILCNWLLFGQEKQLARVNNVKHRFDDNIKLFDFQRGISLN